MAAAIVVGVCCLSMFSSSLGVGAMYPEMLFGKPAESQEKEEDLSAFLNFEGEGFRRGTTIKVNRERQHQSIPLKIQEIKVYDENGLEFTGGYTVTESNAGEDAFYKLEYAEFKPVRTIEIIPEPGCEAALVGATIEFLNSAGTVKWYDNIIKEMPKYEFDILFDGNYTSGRVYNGQCGGLSSGVVLKPTNATSCFSNCNSISNRIEDYLICKDDDDRTDCSPELEDVKKYSSGVTTSTLNSIDTAHKEYCEFKPANSCKFFKNNGTFVSSDTLNCSSNAYCYTMN